MIGNKRQVNQQILVPCEPPELERNFEVVILAEDARDGAEK
jgi:hypothetical protein